MFSVKAIQKHHPIKNLIQTSTNPKQKINTEAQKIFIKNYYSQYVISGGLRWSMLCTGSWALFQYVLRHNVSSALTWLKITAVVGAVWFMRGNDPKRLAKKAFQAIEANEPDKAIEYIQKGADLDKILTESEGSGQLVPFLPIYWYPGLSVSLLEKTVLHDCHKVCLYLISIGFDLNHTRALNMSEDLNTIKLLIENGMPPDVDTSAFYCLAPCNWPSLAWWALKLYGAVDNKKSDEEIIKFIKIINFLRKNGAKEIRADVLSDGQLIRRIDAIPLTEEDQALRSVSAASQISLLDWMSRRPRG